jgi:hypothetical protein
MPKIYEIKTHHKHPQEVAEYWRQDGVCAAGCRWTYAEEYPDEQPTDQWGRFQQISKGDIILAYARPCMVAYVGEVADDKLRCEKNNKTGRRYNYWNQRRVTWWPEPNHFHPRDLPRWIHRQLGSRGTTIKKLDLHDHTFTQAKSIIKTRPRSGSAFASLAEDTVKAGIRNYFLSNAHVFEPGLEIHRVEKEVARGHRPDFEGEDADGSPVIVECKGYAKASACNQLTRYAKNYHRGRKRPRLLLVAFGFEEACRKSAKEARIELCRCNLTFTRDRLI